MPDRLPRVCYSLHLQPGQKFGTLEEQIVLLAREFQKDGSLFLPLFVCAAQDADLSAFRERDVPAASLDLRRFSMTTLFALARLLRENRIDVIHWNFAAPLGNSYAWGLSVLCPRVRHWMTDHNSRTLPLAPPVNGWRGVIKRTLLSRYSRVVCVSQYVLDRLQEQGVWSNLTCAKHFVNTERFRPDEAVRRDVRQRLGATDEFVIVVVGQLIPEKGIDVVIRALPLLPPRVVAWVIGKGPDEDAMRALIAELGVSDRVRMLGLQNDVAPYLLAADCFVCPSRWAEAAGLVNIEAQACGVPVIASRIGGIPEYVEDQKSGFLFESGNAVELAQCVRQLLDDPALRDRFAKNARELAVERFSPAARMPEILDLYRRK